MKLDLNLFYRWVDLKYISVQKHVTADFLIWNYTQRCQFNRFWTPETIMARGLITDSQGTIVARPFKKFWNLEEHLSKDSKLPSLPIEEFEVTEKMDGSMAVLYHLPDGTPQIATRGSFVSDQAKMATQMLLKKLENYQGGCTVFDPAFTWLFEIIYKNNRIVVDYGDTEDLFLLACINTETGEESPISLVDCPFPKVKTYDGITDLSKLKDMREDNKEGFVVKFKSGMRVKVKFEEYVLLHKLITGINSKTIWEMLKNNLPFGELLERVPDEYFDWVKQTAYDIKHEFEVVEAFSRIIFEKVKKLPTRKDQAQAIMENNDSEYSPIVFRMLDHRPYDDVIWRKIQPVATKPFREDIDV